MTEIVALLPMKGRSERVPDKNLRMLGGRPLYHWIVLSLLDVAAITRIVVDTDSNRIKEDVGSTFPSVIVRDRPLDLLGDLVPMHEIVHRFASEDSADVVLQTHSTNPLLKGTTITWALEAYFASIPEHDSLMSVTPLQVRLYDHRFHPMNHDPKQLLRTQDLAVIYEENSNLYISSSDLIRATGLRIGSNPLLYPIGRYEALDIDDAQDFEVAELLIERFRG